MQFLDKHYILASASPRRKEILENAGFKIKVIAANIDESIKVNDINLVAEKLAIKKANAIFKTYKNQPIIAADTIVVCNNKILEKPKNLNEAKAFLTQMSNSQHKVITKLVLMAYKVGLA